MNKQRRVLITTTYNEMGIIIDTKAEEVSNDELDNNIGDTINKQDVMHALEKCHKQCCRKDDVGDERIHYETTENEMECIPSAQPEPIRINLNEPIKVKLTDWGKEIYYHQYDRTNQIAGREICKPRFPREDENGYTEFQLWCFIELYGMHMGMALPNVIEPLEIVYERRQGGQ